MSGGAPISEKVKDFIHSLFQEAVFLDGYATTETGTVSVNEEIPDNVDYILLADPSFNKMHEKDQDGNTVCGEICISSQSTIPGYFKNESLNRQQFVNVGDKTYFRTGDIGRKIIENNKVKVRITGRIKSLIKLSNSEFINPEYLEPIFERNEQIERIFIWAKPTQSFAISIIVPSKKYWDTIHDDSVNIKAYFLKLLSDIGKESNLRNWEIPKNVHITKDSNLTCIDKSQNTFFTSTGKLKRISVVEHYQNIITELYDENVHNEESPFKLVPKLAELLKYAIPSLRLENYDNIMKESFINIGGDSISAITLTKLIKDDFGLNIPVIPLFTCDSLEKLERLIYESTNNSGSDIISKAQLELADNINHRNSVDWEQESKLSPNLKYHTQSEIRSLITDVEYTSLKENIDKTNDILVIGATGYLGPFLVSDIINFVENLQPNDQSPCPVVYCLVRGDDAEDRFIQNSKKLETWDESKFQKYVKIVKGDISKARLGLANDIWYELCYRVKSIFNNAAKVNGIMGYSSLRASNVTSVEEILKLSVIGRPKNIHHISSINVLKPCCDHSEDYLDLYERKVIDSMPGYAQSKLMAEFKLKSALNDEWWSSRMGVITIHRPSTISSHSMTGVCNTTDFTTGCLIGLIMMNNYPLSGIGKIPEEDEDSNLLLLTPVDYVSKSIIQISFFVEKESIPNITRNVYHYVNPNPISWNQYIGYVKLSGIEINGCNDPQWKKVVAEILAKQPNNPLYIFKDDLFDSIGNPIEKGRGPRTDNTKTATQHICMKLSNIYVCPKITPNYISKMLCWLSKNNKIPHLPASIHDLPEENLVSSFSDDPFYRLENWYLEIKDLTFKTNFITLSRHTISMLRTLILFIKTYNNRPTVKRSEIETYTLQISDSGISKDGGKRMNHFLVLEEEDDVHRHNNFSNVLDKVLGKLKNETQYFDEYRNFASQLEESISRILEYNVSNGSNHGVFVRLSSRSPKDAARKTTKFQKIKGLILDNKVAESIAIQNSLEIFSPIEALFLLLNSERISHDLRQDNDSSTFLCVRSFEPIETFYEFRCFVWEGKLNCATSYHRSGFYPAVVENKRHISHTIQEYWNQRIKNNISRQIYTVDLYIHPSFAIDLCRVVEINYPPPVASTILFDWYDTTDRRIIQSGPFELRIVDNET
eukprot:TRINITY_DN7076_c0_g1_i2.p1 TRINITY_DN7076_c0_g1~~TRINITY_DN7076_c0_g1_i2.p1  ORF type:complete len:1164 (+),score=133.05 TRINITY_DN7076_c0_g1_i2:1964-5455(+)